MARPAPSLLIVEDDEDISSSLDVALRREGFTTAVARDGEEALLRLRRDPPDLVILDVTLPRRSGLDVLRTLREEGRSVPVILLTARSAEDDKLRGFRVGADDYVTKPFSVAELVARVRARLRDRAGAPEPAPRRFSVGHAEVDLAALSVRRGPSTERLTQHEAAMLEVLYRERGGAVSRARFIEEAWPGDEPPTARAVDQHIVNLRRKIEEDPSAPRHLVTVFGAGYRLER